MECPIQELVSTLRGKGIHDLTLDLKKIFYTTNEIQPHPSDNHFYSLF
jgi:hypothetical protein